MRNAEVKRLTSLAERTHDAAAAAALIPFIEKYPPAIDFSRIVFWACKQIKSDHVKAAPTSLFAQSLLRCIATVFTTQAGSRSQPLFHKVAPALVSHCTDIWKCVRAVHSQIVNNDNLDHKTRLLTGHTNLAIINLFTALPGVEMNPGTPAILMQIANVETLAASVNFYGEHVEGDVITELNRYLLAAVHTHGVQNLQSGWEKEVLKPMGGDVAGIAMTALWHLRSRLALPETWNNRAACVAHVLAHIMALSQNPSISQALVVQGSIKAVVDVLKSLSKSPYPASQDLSYLVNTACHALVAQIFTVDNLDRQIMAYEAGILPAILRCSKFLIGDVYVRDNWWYMLLFRLLPPFIIYPSILRVASRSLHRFSEISLPPRVEKLYTQLRGMMDDFSQIGPVEASMRLCGKCHEPNELKAQKLCAGCSRVYYCSRRCQMADWETHRDRCKWNQRYHALGNLHSLSPKDHSAIPVLLRHELNVRFGQISDIRRQFALKEPLNVEIDYTVFPIQITVGSSRFVPETDHYRDLASNDREYIEQLMITAWRKPGAIVARYFYPVGDIKVRSRFGELLVLDPPKLKLYSMEGKASESYYLVRARKDDGTYVIVHQP